MSQGWQLDCGFTNDEAQRGAAMLEELLELGAQYSEKDLCLSCAAPVSERHREICVYRRGFEWRDGLQRRDDDDMTTFPKI